MRLVAVADTHGSYKELFVPNGDVLIIAGDLTAQHNSVKQLCAFNAWLGKQPHTYKIVIAGNHDGILETYPGFSARILTNCIYLENSGCIIDGIRFWGSPITPTYLTWYFMADRGKKIQKYWNQIPETTDILITHGPPFSILDSVPLTMSSYKLGEKHLGCVDLLERIKKIKPKVHIFGHIHHSYGQTMKDGILFVNASVMNEQYEGVNKPIVIDI